MFPQAKNGLPRYTVAAIFLIAIVVAVVARWIWWNAYGDRLAADPDSYRRMADRVTDLGTLSYNVRPTAFRPPLYPLVLSLGNAIDPQGTLGIALIHTALGVVTCAAAVYLALAWGLRRGAALAGVLVALDPILLSQSVVVMTETLAAALVAVALVAVERATARPTIDTQEDLSNRPSDAATDEQPGARGSSLMVAATGVLLSLAVLCRPTFLPWMVMLVVYLPMTTGRGRFDVRRFAVLATSVALTLAPWVVRNVIVFGRPIVATTHGGYTLLLANNEDFYRHLAENGPRVAWDAAAFNNRHREFLAHETADEELADNRRAYAEAWSAIRANPQAFLHACLIRASRFWDVLPLVPPWQSTAATGNRRYVVAVWYTSEFVLAAIGFVVAWRKNRTPSLLATVLLAASLTAIHALFWSDMRMRAPLTVCLAVWAGCGAEALVTRMYRRK